MNEEKNNNGYDEEFFSFDFINSNKNSFLIFKVENERYAIKVESITELIRFEEEKLIREVPNLPEYILGVMNIRTTVIPIIDFRKMLNMTYGNYNKFSIIIIVQNSEKIQFGIIVEDVETISPIEETDTKPPKIGNINTDIIESIGEINGQMVLVLNIDNMFK